MEVFILLLILLSLSIPAVSASSSADIAVAVTNPAESNIPQVESYLKSGGLIFDTTVAAPAGEDVYYISYKFNIPEKVAADWFCPVIFAGRGPGAIGQSRYSWSIDGGAENAALRTQKVKQNSEGISEFIQIPVRLTPGQHTLKLYFHPEQRLRLMNRATEAFIKHHVDIRSISMRPTDAPAAVKHQELSKSFKLKSNDSVVLFGDSITEEEFYGRHFVRIIETVFPGNGITVYNSGVSLNRTPEGVARINNDVLLLKPQWTILAFGVNDAMQISPEDFISNYNKMLKPLRDNGIKVLCASPSGMTPNVEALGPTFFSMHATDKAAAIDRSMARNTELLRGVAVKNDALFADIHAAITRTAIPRISLMNNQWHPNYEGGRMFAIALLRALGLTENDIVKTCDARDLAYFRALEMMTAAIDSTPPELKSPNDPLQGKSVFLAGYGDNRVVVCDENGRTKAIFSTPHHPAALAVSRKNNEMYVACEGAGKLQIYSLPAMKLNEEIDLSLESYPNGIAITPDEKTMWIASFFGCKVMEFDIANRKVLRSITMPNVVNGVSLAPDGTLLVSLPNQVAFIDVASGKFTTVDTVKFTANFLRMPDGNIALIDAERWQLLPIDTAAKKVGKPVPAPAQTRAMMYDESGKLFAGDWMNKRLLTIENDKLVSDKPLPISAMAIWVEKF